MNSRTIQTKGGSLQITLSNELGGEAPITITGYASVFGVTDRDSEQTEKGSFAEYLSNIENTDIKLLLEHNSASPIGYITNITEDDYGLYIEGEISPDTSPESVQMILNGNISGLSIGYVVRQESVQDNINHIIKAELVEVSVVSLPSNNLSRITSINGCPTQYFASLPNYAIGRQIGQSQAPEQNQITTNSDNATKVSKATEANQNQLGGTTTIANELDVLLSELLSNVSETGESNNQPEGTDQSSVPEDLQLARLIDVTRIAIKLAKVAKASMATA